MSDADRYRVLAARVQRWVRGEIQPCLRTAREVNALWDSMTEQERRAVTMPGPVQNAVRS